jgi:uncharacterized protein YbcI
MVASVQDSTRSDPSSGTKLAAIADGIVKIHKEVCGRGPTNARCFESGNAVVCLLFGGLTRGERTLLDSGDVTAVENQRRSLHQVMRAPARELVERELGRRVTAMTLAADPSNEMETAVFLLDGEGTR